MWRVMLYFIAFTKTSVTAGLNNHDSKFGIDYFKYRNIGQICVIVCDNKWSNNFVKESSKRSLQVSVASLHKISSRPGGNWHDCLRPPHVSVGVVLDPMCAGTNDIVHFASQNELFDANRKWLIFLKGNTSLSPISFGKSNITPNNYLFSKFNTNINADVTIAVNEGSNKYHLYEFFNRGVNKGHSIIQHSGTWNHKHGIKSNLNEYKYYRRWNFHKYPIKMISVVSSSVKDFDPKVLTDPNVTPGITVFTKTSVTIFSVIADIHNLRFVHTVGDRWIDDYKKNNSQAVVASSLYYKLQDLSPIIRFIKEVFDKIDIIYPPLSSIETRYYYRIPTYGPGKFENQFFRPLSAGAWLCVGAVTFICGVVLLASAKFEMRPSYGQYAIFSVIASFCQQFFEDNASDIRRNCAARKLAVLVTGLSCVLIYNYYTSSVVSWLLSGPPPSINSLQELLESPLELIYEDIGYTRSWLQTSTYYFNSRNAKIEDEIRKKKVFNKKEDAPLLVSLVDGIRMVKAGGYAYHTEVDSASRLISRTFTQSELCQLGSLQSMEKTLLYPCIPKNSPYKEFFNWSLLRLLERGIVKCIQQRTSSPSVTCEGSSPRALALGGAAPAFMLLAFGFTTSFIIMLGERFIWKYHREIKTKRNK